MGDVEFRVKRQRNVEEGRGENSCTKCRSLFVGFPLGAQPLLSREVDRSLGTATFSHRSHCPGLWAQCLTSVVDACLVALSFRGCCSRSRLRVSQVPTLCAPSLLDSSVNSALPDQSCVCCQPPTCSASAHATFLKYLSLYTVSL